MQYDDFSHFVSINLKKDQPRKLCTGNVSCINSQCCEPVLQSILLVKAPKSTMTSSATAADGADAVNRPINKQFLWSEDLSDFLSAIDSYNPTV